MKNILIIVISIFFFSCGSSSSTENNQPVSNDNSTEVAPSQKIETPVLTSEIKEDTENLPTESETSNKESSICLLYTSPSPRDATLSRMPSSA